MDLSTLKRSLSKFPGDFNDSHVLFITKNSISNEREYHLLAGVGCIETKGVEAIALISNEAIELMEQEGSLKFKKDLE